MTLSPDQALYNRILDFVSSETTTRSQNLSGSTDIAKELGVEGDDAVEFMLKFQKEFDVDLSNFHFDRSLEVKDLTLSRSLSRSSGREKCGIR